MSRARATAVVVLRSLPLFGWLFVASPTPSFASAASQEERTAAASKVVTVTGESFDRTIRKDTAYFLMLHVSWCGICKRTFPLFEAAAAVNALQTQSSVVFAHADCTDDKVLAKKFGVQGYPAIYYRDELDMDSTRPRQQQESNSNSKGTSDPPEVRLFPSVEWGGKGELLTWRKYQGGRTTRSFLEYARRMSARPTARALDVGAGAAGDVFAAVEEDRARWAREFDAFAGASGAGGPEGSGNATGASNRENATAAPLVNPKPQETAFVLYTLTAPPSPPGKEKTTPDAQLEIDFDRLSKRFRDTNWFYRVTDAKKAGTVEAVVGGDALLATRASPDKRVRVKYEQEELVSAAISTRTKSYARLEAWAANNRYPGTWNVTDKVFAGFVRSGKPALIAVLAPAAMRAPEAQEKLGRLERAVSGSGIYFGVMDGEEWAKSLQPMNIHAAGLPRLWLITNDFRSWYEDVDLLTLDKVLEALNAASHRQRAAGSAVPAARPLHYMRTGWQRNDAEVEEGDPAEAELRKNSNATALLFAYVDAQFPFLFAQDREKLSAAWFYARELLKLCGVYARLAETNTVPVVHTAAALAMLMALVLLVLAFLLVLVRATVAAMSEEDYGTPSAYSATKKKEQ